MVLTGLVILKCKTIWHKKERKINDRFCVNSNMKQTRKVSGFFQKNAKLKKVKIFSKSICLNMLIFYTLPEKNVGYQKVFTFENLYNYIVKK